MTHPDALGVSGPHPHLLPRRDGATAVSPLGR